MTTLELARKGVHAGAIGAGIAHAIFAVAATASSPEEWVEFCLKAADEAEAAVKESPPGHAVGSATRLLRELTKPGDPEWPDEEDADTDELRAMMLEAGAVAFRACMPKITGRRMAQAYIACVAAGVQRRYFSGGEARALLYTAQLALSAWPRRVARPRETRKSLGFAAGKEPK